MMKKCELKKPNQCYNKINVPYPSSKRGRPNLGLEGWFGSSNRKHREPHFSEHLPAFKTWLNILLLVLNVVNDLRKNLHAIMWIIDWWGLTYITLSCTTVRTLHEVATLTNSLFVDTNVKLYTFYLCFHKINIAASTFPNDCFAHSFCPINRYVFLLTTAFYTIMNRNR